MVITGNQRQEKNDLSEDRKSYSVVRYDPCTYEANEIFVYEVVPYKSEPDVQEKPPVVEAPQASSSFNEINHVEIHSAGPHVKKEARESTSHCEQTTEESVEIGSAGEASVETKSTKSRRSMSGRSRTEGWHICTECSYTTTKRYMLGKHMKAHSKVDYPCPECSRIFVNKNGLTLHAKKHVISLTHECHVCDTRFSRLVELYEHLRHQHPDQKPIKCPECPYETFDRSHMKRHSLLHDDRQQFQCSQCAFSTKTSDNLRKHMLVHSDEQTYRCSVCRKRFQDQVALDEHRILHPVHRCDTCSAPFARLTDLRRHERLLHSTSKQFTCRCQQKFTNKYEYLVHSRSCQGHYQCKLCDFKTDKSGSLRVHKMRKHP